MGQSSNSIRTWFVWNECMLFHLFIFSVWALFNLPSIFIWIISFITICKHSRSHVYVKYLLQHWIQWKWNKHMFSHSKNIENNRELKCAWYFYVWFFFCFFPHFTWNLHFSLIRISHHCSYILYSIRIYGFNWWIG